ncbi:class II fructose-bisphosphate aldolase [Nocardioides marmorisolisilvae]|uniref:class II fructose-bisphosphate aldolase n=1 Tax=Nocardioides marmorisolisilvae TaxID=1542737 RepID=UPI0016211CCD|nr:class II fructose-bisphosphate aldolase [Nocardioides marmorisolisilvae]
MASKSDLLAGFVRHSSVHFSANDLVDARALLSAARKHPGSVGMLLSKRGISYTGARFWSAISGVLKSEVPDLAITVDHVSSSADLEDVLGHRDFVGTVDIVMIDGSERGVEENIDWIRSAKRLLPAHVLVEGAIGLVGESPFTSSLTSADEVEMFVELSGCDLLGVSVNNFHLRSAPDTVLPSLDVDRIALLHAVSPVPLTLHGADFRTDLELHAAAAAGAAKINIGPEYRTAYSSLLAKAEFDGDDFRDPMAWVSGNLGDWVVERVEAITAGLDGSVR